MKTDVEAIFASARHRHQSLPLRYRQGPHEYPINDARDGCVRADARRQRYETGSCKRRCGWCSLPIFEREFAEQSYGFRPNRGCKDALRRVDARLGQGYTWIVDADLKGYFDTIPHAPLMEHVKEKVSDGQVLNLVLAFLKQQGMDGMKSWTAEGGTPQGAVLSPLLSNLYWNPLDHQMQQAGMEMVW